MEDAHSHDMGSGKAGEHMAAMDLVPRAEATNVAIDSGDWFDPDNWSEGRVPGDDERVLIPEGVHMQYGGVSDARLFTVRVDGELCFATDTDSQMIFDTMVVTPTGVLEIGTAADPVHPDVEVNLIVANNGPIDTDWDPMLLSRGIIAHGETSIFGAAKDSHEKVIDDPMAGDKFLSFAEAPEGWQVGDTIVVAGTRYEGYKYSTEAGEKIHYEPEDEVRVITAIEDNRIYFNEALEYNHDTPRADLKTSVANYTRNVSIETGRRARRRGLRARPRDVHALRRGGCALCGIPAPGPHRQIRGILRHQRHRRCPVRQQRAGALLAAPAPHRDQ